METTVSCPVYGGVSVADPGFLKGGFHVVLL